MSSAPSAPPDRARRARRRISRRFRITLVTLISLLIVGVSGYRLLEDMDFVDALYVTITTITTVGFGEVEPLSPVGRLFTIGLIIGGVSIAAYALGSVAQFVVSGDWQTYSQERRRRRMRVQRPDRARPDLSIVARANYEESEAKLIVLGTRE